jgi:FkbM family methyltransferase
MKRDRLRAAIANHRNNPVLTYMARGAEKYLRAYNNQRNWDVEVNGEAHALRLVTSRYDGDVLDVGANVGQWASMASELLRDNRLHCFEAANSNFEKLRTRLGSRPNVILNHFGLGGENKEIEFYFYPEAPTRSTAYYLEDGYKKEKTLASIVRGDDYVSQKHIHTVSYLKIDVEGMEIDVLRGFAATLKAGKIQAVQFEHGQYHIITRHLLKDFVDLFYAADYGVFRILPNELQPLLYDMERDETFTGENFLAIRKDIQKELLNQAPV